MHNSRVLEKRRRRMQVSYRDSAMTQIRKQHIGGGVNRLDPRIEGAFRENPRQFHVERVGIEECKFRLLEFGFTRTDDILNKIATARYHTEPATIFDLIAFRRTFEGKARWFGRIVALGTIISFKGDSFVPTIGHNEWGPTFKLARYHGNQWDVQDSFLAITKRTRLAAQTPLRAAS